jgi:hypothetical protein
MWPRPLVFDLLILFFALNLLRDAVPNIFQSIQRGLPPSQQRRGPTLLQHPLEHDTVSLHGGVGYVNVKEAVRWDWRRLSDDWRMLSQLGGCWLGHL